MVKIFFALILLLSTLHLFSQDVVVVTEEYPPYNYQKNGTVAGIATEKVRKILELAGLSYEIQIYPWPRAYSMALKGDNVLIYSMTRTNKREDLFDWLAFLHQAKFYLYGKSEGRRVVSKEQIRTGNTTAVCIKNVASCEILKEAGFNEKRIYHKSQADIDSQISMTLKGRVDFFLSSPEYLDYRLQFLKVPRNQLHRNLLIYEGKGFYLAAGKQTKQSIKDRIRKAVKLLNLKGTK